jgi:hypothetical protein
MEYQRKKRMTTIRNTAAFDEALKRTKLARLRFGVAAGIGLIVMTGGAALLQLPLAL